jgi:hypothetical protein
VTLNVQMHASDMANESCLWCAIAAIGYYMKPFSGSLEVAHVVLGSIALGLGFLQILAILGRPAPVCCISHRVLNRAAGSRCWRPGDGARLPDAMTPACGSSNPINPAVQPASDAPFASRAQDHKYRKHWSLYHSNVGRLLIAVVVVRCGQSRKLFMYVFTGCWGSALA